MKKLFLLTVFTALSVFAYTQDFYIESFHTGVKEDLSDQEEGTIQKMYVYLDEMYIDYLAKDKSVDLEMDTRLLITDMRKRVDAEGAIFYSFHVAYFDGEYLGKLDITLLEDGTDLFAGCLEGMYFIGKYIKKK